MKFMSRVTRMVFSTIMVLILTLCLFPAMTTSAKAGAPGVYTITVNYRDRNNNMGYTFTRTFDSAGGVYFGMPSAPVLNGYTFGGWEYNGKVYRAGQTITVMGNMDLRAIWGANVKIIWNVYIEGSNTPYVYDEIVTVKYGKETLKSVLNRLDSTNIGNCMFRTYNSSTGLWSGDFGTVHIRYSGYYDYSKKTGWQGLSPNVYLKCQDGDKLGMPTITLDTYYND